MNNITFLKLPQPSLQAIGEDNWQLTLPYAIEFKNRRQRYRLEVTPGATTDGLSKPYWIQWLYGPKMEGDELPAGFVHDLLYASEWFDRKFIDEVFFNLLRENYVTWFKSHTMYVAVRIGGRIVWNHDHTWKGVEEARKHIAVYKWDPSPGIWKKLTPPDIRSELAIGEFQ